MCCGALWACTCLIPGTQNLVLLPLQTSPENPTHRVEAKLGHASCSGPRARSPRPCPRPRPQPWVHTQPADQGPVLGADRRGSLLWLGNGPISPAIPKGRRKPTAQGILWAPTHSWGRTRPSPPQGKGQRPHGGPTLSPAQHTERQRTDEPKRAVGGTGARLPGGGRSHEFKGRKHRQSPPFWSSGQAAESMGLSTTRLGVGLSPAPPCSLPDLSSSRLSGDHPPFHHFWSKGPRPHFNI